MALLRVPPVGLWMWASWVIQLCLSVALCLLAVLDVGNQAAAFNVATTSSDVDDIPVYALLDSSWMLATVAITYAIAVLSDTVLMISALRNEKPELSASDLNSNEPDESGELLPTSRTSDTSSTRPIVIDHPTEVA